MIGAELIAKSLKSQGVTHIFGVVGIPVIEVAEACMQEGIHYIGFRNEQAASYAANAWGYLSGRPGVCLVVSGPGFVHALAGVMNARENAWPMLLIAGSSDTYQHSQGGFQEMNQVESARSMCKFSARPSSIEKIPAYVQKAINTSICGRPGPCYIDLPGDFITGTVSSSFNFDEIPLPKLQVPRSLAEPDLVQNALELLLKSSKRPLVIIGKGAAYSRGSESHIASFIEQTNLPFLPTPMGKGVLSDTHSHCVGAARSFALKTADCVLLIGARLNWILHFGEPPRFNPNVRFIQIEILPEEYANTVGQSRLDPLFLCGDISSVMQQFSERCPHYPKLPKDTSWWKELSASVQKNRSSVAALCRYDKTPMNYYRALWEVKSQLPVDFVLVSEGANTMDIGRTVIDQFKPRTRLDAGTFGTMGVGTGFAIAAQLYYPNQRVICIQGDSAFGFSSMELETICRFKLPIVFIVINNNGIYSGVEKEVWEDCCNEADKSGELVALPRLLSTSLLPDARYEKIMEAFGGAGYFARTSDELRNALVNAMKTVRPALINCIIETASSRKQQEFSWLTRKEDSKL